MEQIIKIATFILDSFIHIWPYLLITIPIAVAVQISGAAKFIKIALNKRPMLSILLATAVGAFSPFCSCGVIPVITTLLLGGVPIAPVMSFWLASPSMDPEIFFLSVATVGWNLSVWRLAATFIISLSAGYITHFAMTRGYLGKEVLRLNQGASINQPTRSLFAIISVCIKKVLISIVGGNKQTVQLVGAVNTAETANVNCCVSTVAIENTTQDTPTSCGCGESKKETPKITSEKIMYETWKATLLVVKFMSLAFFINALINFYVPQEFISNLLGGDGSSSVLIATLIGIPAYTSNLAALPLVSGLISLGMNHGAALTFLIAGPTTTLPAMIAVWGITKRRVFILYISYSLIGAILFGILFNLFN